MNLDNALTTFDGPPFPLRLRMILERATSLSTAKRSHAGGQALDWRHALLRSAPPAPCSLRSLLATSRALYRALCSDGSTV